MVADTQHNADFPPGLEERFQQPPGWRWHSYKSPRGAHKIRFGTVAPQGSVPDAVVVCLQGLGEFTEKYYELARDLTANNLSFWMMDWHGQGKSGRYLTNSQKRHSVGFDEDIAELHYFIMEYIKHAAVHPEVGRIPLVMLGHSTGANIGLHYLHHHPDSFACAAFVAPLLKVHALRWLPDFLSLAATGVFQEIADHKAIGFGSGDWRPETRDDPARNVFSSDEARRAVHNAWFRHDPALPVGEVTYGWLHAANKSCARLRRKNIIEEIHTPCLLALAGKERLVDNAAIRQIAARLPHGKLLEFPGAKHEILMERDEFRSAFLGEFYEMLRANKIKEKLKPF